MSGETLEGASVPLNSFALSQQTERLLESRLPGLLKSRIILLGEPDHYIEEKYEYQLMLLRFLIERGCSRIGFEMGHARAMRFDQYLASGDEELLWPSPEEERSRQSPSGILRFDLDSPWLAKDGERRRAFFRALRQVVGSSRAGRVKVFGFDVDFFPQAAYAPILHSLRLAAAQETERLARLIDDASRREVADAALAVDSIIRLARRQKSTLRSHVGPQYRDIEVSLEALRESLRFNTVAMRNPTHSALLAALRSRERAMYRLVEHHLRDMDSDSRLVLLGHNMHLSKNASGLMFGAGENARSMWPSIGTHLAERFGSEVFGVWLLVAYGTHGDLASAVPTEFHAPPDAIEARLAQIGERLLVPISETQHSPSDMFVDQTFLQNGKPGTGRIGLQADAILFARTARAPGLLPRP